MQNSNLSAKIFPAIKEDWLLFIQRVSKELQEMTITYNNDKRRVKDLERIVNKMKEIEALFKDNIKDILNYREIFIYIDNSLESSFDALKFFVEQDDFDNVAVKAIYERIINSPKIIQINSEYNSLIIKVQFVQDRIKRLNSLVHGNKVDYALIRELLDKYKLSDDKKKNILFYPVVMLSIRQNDINNKKVNLEEEKIEKEKFYRDRFNEICELFQNTKDRYKDLLISCFNVRSKMSPSEIDTYSSLVNNPNEINDYEFNDDIKYKIYTLSFFKIKKDIEDFINGISDLITDKNDLDDEIAFFQSMIDEFIDLADKLKSLTKEKKENSNVDETENNVFFALDAFNRLIINEDLLTTKNKSSIKALIEKANNTSSSKINGLRTIHMQGVSDAEKILDRNISLLITSKFMVAYIMVGRNVLILSGDLVNTERFSKVINRIVEHNAIPIKKQIALIKENNLDYIDLQNRILETILMEEKEKSI